MFNNEIYISPKYKIEDYLNLELSIERLKKLGHPQLIFLKIEVKVDM